MMYEGILPYIATMREYSINITIRAMPCGGVSQASKKRLIPYYFTEEGVRARCSGENYYYDD